MFEDRASYVLQGGALPTELFFAAGSHSQDSCMALTEHFKIVMPLFTRSLVT